MKSFPNADTRTNHLRKPQTTYGTQKSADADGLSAAGMPKTPNTTGASRFANILVDVFGGLKGSGNCSRICRAVKLGDFCPVLPCAARRYVTGRR